MSYSICVFGLANGWSGKSLVAILGGAAVLSLGLGIFAPKTINNGTACTMEAKLCPDGSYVARSGPNCEFATCPTSNEKGTLKGRVTIGPMCPVDPCNSSTNPYAGKKVSVTSQAGKVINTTLGGDGSFSVTLAAGIYAVNLSECQYLGCSKVLPQRVTVESGKTSNLTISIDTGIR